MIAAYHKKNKKKKLSGGNRLAGCVYVCVAKIASFFHERYLVVFAGKATFAQKNCIFKDLAKKGYL